MILLIILLFFSFNAEAYNRTDYKHWIDADKDCQNTRQEVLINNSLVAITLDAKGCKVIGGEWYDFYTATTIKNPKLLDIDHIVPLAEVDRSGGDKWSKKKKMQYANDFDVLLPVNRSANRSKGDKDPSDWMPKNSKFHCAYLQKWVEIKKKWELEMDEKERLFIEVKNKECGSQNR
tara:strand:+ start:106 stop:636 length:531 start_codon:yes stop_codon:yes gene_type:complete